MARPIQELPTILKRYRLTIERQFDEGVQDVAIMGGLTMVANTRVDTGKARSNYIATLDAASRQVIPPYAPGRKLGFNEGANLNAAHAQHKRVARRYRSRKNRSIVIANNVHYIWPLNEGINPLTPNPPPPGKMLEKGRIAAINVARRIRLLVGKKRTVRARSLNAVEQATVDSFLSTRR